MDAKRNASRTWVQADLIKIFVLDFFRKLSRIYPKKSGIFSKMNQNKIQHISKFFPNGFQILSKFFPAGQRQVRDTLRSLFTMSKNKSFVFNIDQ